MEYLEDWTATPYLEGDCAGHLCLCLDGQIVLGLHSLKQAGRIHE